MTMKKKIVIVALVVCIFAMSIASATLAYFTDEAALTNTFMVGNVEIKLDENAVEQAANGNYVAKGTERTETGFDVPTSLFPMQNISKDPTITVTGSEDAYIGAVITIKNGAGANGADVSKMLTFDGDDPATVDAKAVKVNKFLDGLIDANTATVKYKKVGTDVKVYVVVTAAQAENAKVVLFDSVQIDADWNNAEMANLSDLEIVVEAYAVQTAGFAATDSLGVAEVAIKAAFPAEFADYFA